MVSFVLQRAHVIGNVSDVKVQHKKTALLANQAKIYSLTLIQLLNIRCVSVKTDIGKTQLSNNVFYATQAAQLALMQQRNAKNALLAIIDI